jgi:hypothetical protein
VKADTLSHSLISHNAETSLVDLELKTQGKHSRSEQREAALLKIREGVIARRRRIKSSSAESHSESLPEERGVETHSKKKGVSHLTRQNRKKGRPGGGTPWESLGFP